jgi:hypothetical protein
MPFSDREHGLFCIEFALRQAVAGKVKRAIDDDLKLAAEKIMRHIELSGFHVVKRPRPSDVQPTSNHSRYSMGWPEERE